MADAVAGKGQVPVGRVLAPRLPQRAQVGFDLRPAGGEQWAQNPPLRKPHHRVYARESLGPCAAQELCQNRLRLVVARVGGGHGVHRTRGHQLAKPCITQPPGRFLDGLGRFSRCRIGRACRSRIHARLVKGQTEAVRQLPAKIPVRVCFGPTQAVMQMRRVHHEAQFAASRGQRPQQRDRIRAAGKSHPNPQARLQQGRVESQIGSRSAHQRMIAPLCEQGSPHGAWGAYRPPYTQPMFETRTATTADVALIASHRRAMFAAMGGHDEALLDGIHRASEPWVARMIAEGKYLGWITTDKARPIASAGLLILDWPPHPFDPTGEKRGYLLNFFVDPEYRRRGLARSLVELCLAEARRRSIRVVSLHASPEGRTVYEQLGFRPTNEMLFVDSQTEP